jgi:hypothetical protein
MPANANARPWLGIHPLLLDDVSLVVETSGVRILVRATDGSFREIYKQAPDSAELTIESEWFSKSRESRPLTLAHFRARAWRLANDKAVELGWF